MNQEMTITLQHILNSLEFPSFICEENKVILTNKIFESQKFEKTCCLNYWKKKHFSLQKTKINDNLYLCQLTSDEVKMLKQCTQELAKAVNLL